VLVSTGVLASPWLIDAYLPISFPWLHIEYVTDADVKRAIGLVAGGILLVWLGYRGTGYIASGGTATLPNSLLASKYPLIASGLDVRAVAALFVLCAGIVSAVFMSESSAILAAVSAGFEGETYYAARAALDRHGRLFAYLAINILPFLATCAAGATWHTHKNRLLATGLVAVSSLILVLTFKKIFLLNLALSLVATWYVVRGDAGQWALARVGTSYAIARIWRPRSLWPLVGVLLGLFVFVAGSYYVVAAGDLSPLLAAGFAIERLFSRLTVMALIYSHYFPGISDHYGLSNIQALSELMGTRAFEDTVVTVDYFTYLKGSDNSGACGAIMDFYGAFGWIGWAVLSPLLGVALCLLDRALDRLSPLVVNKVFHVYMLLTVTFLAQASLFRTLSTYGGGVILLTWLTISLLMRSGGNSARR
jgi:hypothetical protein